jgi:hypothetical protein
MLHDHVPSGQQAWPSKQNGFPFTPGSFAGSQQAQTVPVGFSTLTPSQRYGPFSPFGQAQVPSGQQPALPIKQSSISDGSQQFVGVTVVLQTLP